MSNDTEKVNELLIGEDLPRAPFTVSVTEKASVTIRQDNTIFMQDNAELWLLPEQVELMVLLLQEALEKING